MNPNTNPNYLTNSLQSVQRFAGQVLQKTQEGISRKPWGRYATEYGPVRETIKQTVQPESSALKMGAADVAAAATLDALTNETRKDVWRFTNMHRIVGDVGQYVGPRLGLDSPLAGAVVAAAVPATIARLSGQAGPLSQGLRPAGYKAAAPVSKEEDPSGRKSTSPLAEAGMRYVLGQKSQLLPYKEFKEERPDIAPSTYVEYRRYERLKPEAGKMVIVDPEAQTFSALGGVIKGTARGLNDPEIRLKGVPVTASAVLGTAAGLGAIKGLSKALSPNIKLETGTRQELISRTPSIGEKVAERLGQYTDPALLAAGAITAAAVGTATKKVFQKATERRIKKENPVEYLKYKHGSLQEAAQALNQPGAQSWQQLVPYVK
jgi:hypothetical protein